MSVVSHAAGNFTGEPSVECARGAGCGISAGTNGDGAKYRGHMGFADGRGDIGLWIGRGAGTFFRF